MTVTPHPEDRTCSHPGCITVLCAYNPGPECYSHGQIDAVPRPEMERVAYDHIMKQVGYGERIAA